METIRNFYTIAPNELKSGDVLVCKVVAHITKWQEQAYYSLYRCQSNDLEGSTLIPQGNRIYEDVEEVMKQCFPVLNQFKPE